MKTRLQYLGYSGNDSEHVRLDGVEHELFDISEFPESESLQCVLCESNSGLLQSPTDSGVVVCRDCLERSRHD